MFGVGNTEHQYPSLLLTRMPGVITMALTDLFGRALAGFALQALRVLAAFGFDAGMVSGFPVAFANLLRRTVRGGVRQVLWPLATLHVLFVL